MFYLNKIKLKPSLGPPNIEPGSLTIPYAIYIWNLSEVESTTAAAHFKCHDLLS